MLCKYLDKPFRHFILKDFFPCREEWRRDLGRTEDYFQTLVSAFEMRLAVGVLRIPGGHGLDITKAGGGIVPTLTASSSTGGSRARKVSTDSDSAGPMDRSESKTSVDSGYEAVSGRGGGSHHDHHLETVIDKIRAKFRHDSTTSPTDSEVSDSSCILCTTVGQELGPLIENSDVHLVRQCMEIFVCTVLKQPVCRKMFGTCVGT